MLKFFGRGAGFSDNHNTAFFVKDSSLVLMDCSMMAFIKLKNKGPDYFASINTADRNAADVSDKRINRIVILVTHTHSDHVAGIPMLIHYCHFIWQIKVSVVVPSEEVKADLEYYFEHLDGCSKETYQLVTPKEFGEDWIKTEIPTEHVPELAGKCFGYNLEIDGVNVVYTGDSCRIEDFIPFIGEGTFFYTECSIFDSGVHTLIDNILVYDDLFAEKNVKVILMHLDDEPKIMQRLQSPHRAKYTFAPLFN